MSPRAIDMTLIVVCMTAALVSALTLFSGFGLGTLLMPVAALFFPIEIAIAMTAMVHLANNLFKLGLLGKQADKSVLITFGVPAVFAAFAGATLLAVLKTLPPIYRYGVLGQQFQISPLKLVIGLLIATFVLAELSERFSRFSLDRQWLSLGGAISGFFGGLSGHQGAFRSMFLIKSGLGKEAFIATGIVIAVMVDVARMLVYGTIFIPHSDVPWGLVGAASLSAFAGAYIGTRVLKKVTLHAVRICVSALLMLVAIGLILGLL